MTAALAGVLALCLAGDCQADARSVCTGLCGHLLRGGPYSGKDKEQSTWRSSLTGLATGVQLRAALGTARGKGLEPRSLQGWRTADTWAAGAVGAGWLATRLFERQPPTLSEGCWSDCVPAPSEGSSRSDQRSARLNGLDRWARGWAGGRSLAWRARMDRASDFLLWASIGLPLGMTAVGPERSGRDTAVLAGTFAVNILVVDAVKRLADRPRPFAHFCEPPSLADLRGEDAHFSFYSGHASTAFAMAVFAGRLADSRRYSGTTRALVWTAGLSMAASTAALRVAADKHYLIDVTVGAAAGTLVGLAASKLHKPRGSPSPSAARPVVTIPVPLGSRTVVGIDGRGRPSLRASWRW